MRCAPVRDEALCVLQLVVLVPHAARVAHHVWHRRVHNHVGGHMQIRDALAAVDHGQRGAGGVGGVDLGEDLAARLGGHPAQLGEHCRRRGGWARSSGWWLGCACLRGAHAAGGSCGVVSLAGMAWHARGGAGWRGAEHARGAQASPTLPPEAAAARTRGEPVVRGGACRLELRRPLFKDWREEGAHRVPEDHRVAHLQQGGRRRRGRSRRLQAARGRGPCGERACAAVRARACSLLWL